jgi:hypothetical protein
VPIATGYRCRAGSPKMSNDRQAAAGRPWPSINVRKGRRARLHTCNRFPGLARAARGVSPHRPHACRLRSDPPRSGPWSLGAGGYIGSQSSLPLIFLSPPADRERARRQHVSLGASHRQGCNRSMHAGRLAGRAPSMATRRGGSMVMRMRSHVKPHAQHAREPGCLAIDDGDRCSSGRSSDTDDRRSLSATHSAAYVV